MTVAQVHLTRSTDATVYVALDLGIVTAMVVRDGEEWQTRCYTASDEYAESLTSSRQTAEEDALAHTLRLVAAVDTNGLD